MKISLLIIILLSFNIANANTLYSFGFFCTSADGEQTRNSAKSDLDYIQSQIKAIAISLNFEISPHYFCDKNFRIDSAWEILRRYNFSTGDIVFIYFCTHGSRFNNQKSRFPAAFISNSDLVHDIALNSLPFESFCKQVSKKNPSFLIGIIDACNNYLPLNAPVEWENSWLFTSQGIDPNPIEGNVNDYFLHVKGEILISSTSAGEKSLSRPEKNIFPENFFNAIKKRYASELISWDTVLTEVGRKTSVDVASYLNYNQGNDRGKLIQTPYWTKTIVQDFTIPYIPNTTSIITFDEFETFMNRGKTQFNIRHYKEALSAFSSALQLKKYNTYAKLYIFICEAYLNCETFSNMTLSPYLKTISMPEYESILKQRNFKYFQYAIGISYLRGKNGCPKSLKKGVKWLEFSSNNGFMQAFERLQNLKSPDKADE